MPAMERMSTSFDPTLDKLSNKLQEIRNRKAKSIGGTASEAMDTALETVGEYRGTRLAREAEAGTRSLAMDLARDGGNVHRLDPDVVADLIADPFEE